ncbi:hypothetical protein LQW54_004886 [Pestalotiopsis sp. IQ-011]
MVNAVTQLQVSRPAMATHLTRSTTDVLQELSHQVLDPGVKATLLSICRAMLNNAERSTVGNRKKKRIQNGLISWVEVTQLYLGGAAYSSRSKGRLARLYASAPTTYTLANDQWGETLRWSRALADKPHDAMGEEHFRFMGLFQGYGDAAPDTFERIAVDAFEQRLGLSRRYGTWFAEQVSPGWRDGNPRKCYQERWDGGYDRLVWSFGIQGHPRADQIWHLMRKRLPRNPDPVTREFPDDVTDIEPALRPETKAVRSWTFAYQSIELSIYEDRRGNLFLCHARSRDIPSVIRPRLTQLWNATLDRCNTYYERLSSLAEFEWLWYWTNPFVRGGATTGGVLSAFLQRALRNEGLKVHVHGHFVMQDLYALSSDWSFYVLERVAELSSARGKLITDSDYRI